MWVPASSGIFFTTMDQVHDGTAVKNTVVHIFFLVFFLNVPKNIYVYRLHTAENNRIFIFTFHFGTYMSSSHLLS